MTIDLQIDWFGRWRHESAIQQELGFLFSKSIGDTDTDTPKVSPIQVSRYLYRDINNPVARRWPTTEFKMATTETGSGNDCWTKRAGGTI